MRIAICNTRESNGISAGTGRNRHSLPKYEEYQVYTSQPADFNLVKFDAWRVHDKEVGKTFNVTRKQDTEVLACQCPSYWVKFKELDGKWKDFGYLDCTCQHTLAVRMFEEATKKTDYPIEHAASWIVRDNKHKLNSPEGAKDFWRGVRVYANRKRLQLAALTQAIMTAIKEDDSFQSEVSGSSSTEGATAATPTATHPETWREGDLWTPEVRKTLTTNPQFRKEHNAAHRRSPAATPCVRRAVSTMEKKKAQKLSTF